VQTTGNILSGLLHHLGLTDGVEGWRAVDEWAEAVGPRIARRTRALGFQDGVLMVEVEGSAWQYELGFLKRRLLKELQRRLGSARVRELRFVQTRGGIRR
jgi:predicted nucleic acid-binding Zn ribbon protein